MVLDHSLKEYKYFTFQKPPNLIWIGNLTGFYLQDNQLSGITPDEICNPTQLVVNLENNQLCPPYPSRVKICPELHKLQKRFILIQVNPFSKQVNLVIPCTSS